VNLLSQLVPGFRELRAPLIAGYIWLFLLWLIFGESLPSESSDPVFERAWEAGDAAGKVILGAAFSVIAYLVGSLIQSVTSRLVLSARYWPVIGVWLAPRQTFPTTEVNVSSQARSENLRFVLVIGGAEPDFPGAGGIVGLGGPPVGRGEIRRIQNIVDILEHRELGPCRDALIQAVEGAGPKATASFRSTSDGRPLIEFPAEVDPEMSDIEQNQTFFRFEIPRFDPQRNLLMEIPRLSSRLLELSPRFGDRVERIRSEAEFRQCIIWPLGCLSIALAITVNPFWIFSLVAPVALLIQSRSLELEADLEVMDALRARVNTSEMEQLTSVFEQYRTRCDALAKGIDRGRWDF